MRILFLARGVNAAADFGDGVHVRELVSAWVRKGHHVDLVCLADDPDADHARLRRQLGDIGLEVIPTKGIWRFYPIRQVAAARLAIRVVRYGEFLAIYARPPVGISGSFDLGIEVLTSCLADVPLFLEINGWAEQDASARRPSRFTKFRSVTHRIARLLFAHAQGIVAVNESLAARLRDDLNVEAGKIRIVPNAANPDVFRPQASADARAALGLPPNIPILVFVGHVGLEADLEPVIASVAQLLPEFPELLLIVVGGGEDIPRYRHLADELGIAPRVRFEGPVPHEQVPVYVNSGNVGLVAIRADWTSTPLKLLEYWSCGRPVVGTNLADHRIIAEVGGGLLVRENTAHGWAEAIRQVLRSPMPAENMGRLGREFVLRERTWARVADSIAEFVGDQTRPRSRGPTT